MPQRSVRLIPVHPLRLLLSVLFVFLSIVPSHPTVSAQQPVRETLPSGVVRETWSGLPSRTLAVDSLAVWDLWGEDVGYTFSYVRGAVGGPDGFYLIDARNSQVVNLDRQGRVREVIGREGAGPGEFGYPRNIDLWDGTIYVADFDNQRLSLFDAQGRFLRSHRWRGRGRPAGDVRIITGEEVLYVLTDQDGRWALLRQGLDERRAEELASFQSLAVVHTIITGPDGREYDFDEPPTFAPELHWATDGRRRLLTVTSGEYRIEERDLTGRILGETVVQTPVLRVTERDREWFLGTLTLGFSGVPGQSFDPTPQLRRRWAFADTRPAVAGLALDPLGRLWVEANTPDPAVTRIDLFDAQRRYLGSLEGLPLPRAFTPDGTALCRVIDEETGTELWLLLRVGPRP